MESKLMDKLLSKLSELITKLVSGSDAKNKEISELKEQIRILQIENIEWIARLGFISRPNSVDGKITKTVDDFGNIVYSFSPAKENGIVRSTIISSELLSDKDKLMEFLQSTVKK